MDTESKQINNPCPLFGVPEYYLAIWDELEKLTRLIAGPYQSENEAFADAENQPADNEEVFCIAAKYRLNRNRHH